MSYSEGMAIPGSGIRPKRDVTRRQRPMRALVSSTLQRNLRANMHRTRLLGYSLQPDRLTGWFHIHNLFDLSKDIWYFWQDLRNWKWSYKIFEEMLCYWINQYLSSRYIRNRAFTWNISSKLSGHFWKLWVLPTFYYAIYIYFYFVLHFF